MKEKLTIIQKNILSLPTKILNAYKLLIEHVITIIGKSKDLANTNYELGIFHLNKGNFQDAKMRFIFATKIKKDFALAYYHLSRCYLNKFEYQKAKIELEKALSIDPSLSLAKTRLDFINKEFTGNSIPIDIIKEDFDVTSFKYEELMAKDYAIYNVLVSDIASILPSIEENYNSYTCLDLGCGTGLVGASLIEKVTVKSLIGVDISRNMINLAKSLEIDSQPVYTETILDDINNLSLVNGKFDIITSCISLCYCSDLSIIINNLDKLSNLGTILGIVVLKSEQQDIIFDYSYSLF
jgi:predicted TPR repeat methyltransferase